MEWNTVHIELGLVSTPQDLQRAHCWAGLDGVEESELRSQLPADARSVQEAEA
jgi:hypothetical protein